MSSSATVDGIERGAEAEAAVSSASASAWPAASLQSSKQQATQSNAAHQDLEPPILPPSSPAFSLSMGSPLLSLPGSMPSSSRSAETSKMSISNDTPQAYLPKAGAPPSSSGLTSFFRSFSLSSGSPAPSVAPPADALQLQSHNRTVSSLVNDGGISTNTGTPSTSSAHHTQHSKNASVSHASRPASSSSAASSIVSTTNNTAPAGPSNSSTPPVLAGGTQVRRAFSNSSAARRMRKLSNPIPSFLGGPGNSGGKDSPTSMSSPLASSSPSGEAQRSLTPRHSAFKEKEKEEQQRTPTQSNQQSLPSTGSGLFTSSLNFLSSFAQMEKLPSVLGLSSLTAKETYPRGEDAGSRADPIEDMDLRIEDATGDDEVYSDSPPSAYDRARNKGLQDAARLESSDHDTFEPETPARTWTSTTLESGSSPRHALSPSHSNLTYASTSSLSLHDDTESSSNAGLPPANASSYSMTTNDNHSSILDPVTYQALKRKNSEADAKRVERERQDRSRQLDLLDRLQEQAENPHLRYVDNRGQVMPDKRPEANRKASSPLVPRGDNVHKGIGLGAPPVFSADSANNTPEVKKSRRKSLFGRLGFSPSNKSSPSSSASASKKSNTSTPPVPQVRLAHSNSVSSFGSTQAAPSFVGSFQAVAEATATEDGHSHPITPSASSRAIDIVGSPHSDTGAESLTTPASPVANAHSKSSSKKSRYIKTKTKNKSKREFNHLFLAQELDLNPSTDLLSPTSYNSMADVPETPSAVDFPVAASTASKNGSKVRKASKAAHHKGDKKNGKGVPSSTWTLKFSREGNYLASAGQDGIIRIWQVISGSEERENVIKAMQAGDQHHHHHEDAASEAGGSGIVIPAAVSFADNLSAQPSISKKDKRNSKISIISTSTQGQTMAGSPPPAGAAPTSSSTSSSRPYAPVFGHKPLHEWKGHTSDILDLSWSKNNFLISSSVDKTVRLWHISRKECLCAFQHPDFVTSIAFHPKDDRYFLSGSLDAKLRLWSIPDKKVHCWTQLPELITSVAFTSDGKLACAGTFVGLCLFFDVRDLAFVAKLHSRSARGKYAKGRKITSIVTLPKGEPSEPERILVTSNDSRLRLWDISNICGPVNESKPGIPRLLSERHIDAKYKAHENTSSQIRATFSDDGRYVISGSEDRQCYIWLSGLLDFPAPFAQTSKKGADKSPGCESFNPSLGNDCHCPISTSPGIVTCAIFAPTETRVTLARGGDPLLNSEDGEHEGQRGNLQRSASQASSSSSSNPNEKPDSSARSEDNAVAPASGSTAQGLIIITADDNSGILRVFRNNAIYSQHGVVNTKEAKSISSSTKEKYFLNGDAAQRRGSQISKLSRTTSRIRTSMDRQRRGGDNVRDETEELTA